jgi:hypothetical protein
MMECHNALALKAGNLMALREKGASLRLTFDQSFL